MPVRKTKLLDDYGLTFELIEAVVAMESAARFDELTRRGEPKGVHGWPRYWAYGHLMSAVDYLEFSRLRSIILPGRKVKDYRSDHASQMCNV